MIRSFNTLKVLISVVKLREFTTSQLSELTKIKNPRPYLQPYIEFFSVKYKGVKGSNHHKIAIYRLKSDKLLQFLRTLFHNISLSNENIKLNFKILFMVKVIKSIIYNLLSQKFWKYKRQIHKGVVSLLTIFDFYSFVSASLLYNIFLAHFKFFPNPNYLYKVFITKLRELNLLQVFKYNNKLYYTFNYNIYTGKIIPYLYPK
jgi:hypothetical protein